MADPRAPTRADLAKFLPDQRTIRAFEKLFELIPDDYSKLIEDAIVQAGTADARSQMAIDAFERIADALETLSKAPPEVRDMAVVCDYIDLPINGPHIQKERRVQWNDDDGTLDVGLYNGSVLQVGQEIMYYAKNTSGAQIDNGSAVMFTGTVGASGKLTFGLAVSDGTYPADYMMGIATQDIVNNAFGYVTQFGLVRGFDTTGSSKTVPESWNDGDLLYFDDAYPGELTKNMPSAPAFHVPVAVVINAGSGGSGSIFVRMKSGESLNTLNDVYLNGGGPSAGQLVIYDATQARWENANLTAGTGISITDGDASIEISAVSNALPLRTQVETPSATGFNVTIVSVVSSQEYDVWLLLKPTAGFATGTITLPANTVCVDQQLISVSCTQQVTTLTVAGNGATVNGAPTALAADSSFMLRYNAVSNAWHAIA